MWLLDAYLCRSSMSNMPNLFWIFKTRAVTFFYNEELACFMHWISLVFIFLVHFDNLVWIICVFTRFIGQPNHDPNYCACYNTRIRHTRPPCICIHYASYRPRRHNDPPCQTVAISWQVTTWLPFPSDRALKHLQSVNTDISIMILIHWVYYVICSSNTVCKIWGSL